MAPLRRVIEVRPEIELTRYRTLGKGGAIVHKHGRRRRVRLKLECGHRTYRPGRPKNAPRRARCKVCERKNLDSSE